MKLQLYVLKEALVALAFAVGGLTFIALPGLAVSGIHKLGGISVSVLLGFIPLMLVDLLPYLLPIAFMLAMVVAYGRLAEDNEWTAILMAGVHPLRMLVPALAVAGALCGVSLWLTTEVAPGLRYKQIEYLRSSFERSFRSLNRGQTELSFGAFYLSSRYRDPGTNTFRDVLIHIPSGVQGGDRESERTVIADTAMIALEGDTMEVALANARHVGDGLKLDADSVVVSIDLNRLFDTPAVINRSWKYVNSRELTRRLRNGEVNPKHVSMARFEWHHRITIATTYFMFLLLAIPTALILSRGTHLVALTTSVSYALLYWVLSMRLSKMLGTWGVIPPGLSAWSVQLSGSLAGAWLCWKVFRR